MTEFRISVILALYVSSAAFFKTLAVEIDSLHFCVVHYELSLSLSISCEFVDVAEQLAIDRAKKLFSAEHANVQPHSGTQANMAVYFTVLNPGDTILSMELSHGGHLSHGSPVSFSGRFFRVVYYGVNKR